MSTTGGWEGANTWREQRLEDSHRAARVSEVCPDSTLSKTCSEVTALSFPEHVLA